MVKAIFLVLALGVVLMAGCGNQSDLEIVLEMDDAMGVTKGTGVFYSGLRIGEISDVAIGGSRKLEAQVIISKDYRESISKNAIFDIKQPSEDHPDPWIDSTPGIGDAAQDGDVFKANPGWGTRVTKWTMDNFERITNKDTRIRLEEWKKEVDSAMESGKKGWEEHSPKLKEEARVLLKKLKEESDEKAVQIREQLEDFIAETDTEES